MKPSVFALITPRSIVWAAALLPLSALAQATDPPRPGASAASSVAEKRPAKRGAQSGPAASAAPRASASSASAAASGSMPAQKRPAKGGTQSGPASAPQ